jgi:hypothetical protein
MLNETLQCELKALEARRRQIIRLGERHPDLEIEKVRWWTIFYARSVNSKVDQYRLSAIEGTTDLGAYFWVGDDLDDRVHAAPHVFVVASTAESGCVIEQPNWAEHMRTAEIPEAMIARVGTSLAEMSARSSDTNLEPDEDCYLDLDSASLTIAMLAGDVFFDAFFLDRATLANETYRAISRRAQELGIGLYIHDPAVLRSAQALNARVDQYQRELREDEQHNGREAGK